MTGFPPAALPAAGSQVLKVDGSRVGGYGGYNQDHEFFGYRQSI
jgi:hypothetical protein